MSTYRFSTLGAELASLAHTAEMAEKAGVDARIECNSAQFRPYPSGPMAPKNKSQSSAPGPFTTNESNRRQSSA